MNDEQEKLVKKTFPNYSLRRDEIKLISEIVHKVVMLYKLRIGFRSADITKRGIISNDLNIFLENLLMSAEEQKIGTPPKPEGPKTTEVEEGIPCFIKKDEK